MNEDEKDVKKEDKTSSEQSTEKKDSPVGDDVKAREDKVNELLDRDKRVVEKDRLNELLDKSKLYEDNMLLIDKLNKRPDIVKELLEPEKKGSLEEQVSQLVEENKTRKQRELREAVTEAFDTWKDFAQAWKDEGLADDIDRLVKRGLSHKEAIRRSYLALHPEAIQAEAERMANKGLNEQGAFSTNGSYSPKSLNTKTRQLSEGDKAQARMRGMPEDKYADLLAKHDKYLRARGFYDDSLEIPLSEELGRKA